MRTFSHLAFTLALQISYFLSLSFHASAVLHPPTAPQTFTDSFVVTWAPSKVKILGDGHELHLSLDQYSGSGFASKHSYLFGNVNMQIKLVPGDSAGTVTAYYLASQSTNRDEIDFEFLGNVSGQPYVLQTNVYSNGIGGREQRIYLWFDPTTDFHTYSVSWNKQHILFVVDGTPIRVFSNNEAFGVPFPKKQPMGIFSSLWNADDWATRGGLEKINWHHAPFVASYRNFQADACLIDNPRPSMDLISACTSSSQYGSSLNGDAATTISRKLQWVKKNYMIYDYCTDKLRYPVLPVECYHVNF